MANKRIDDLPASGALTDASLFETSNGGVSQKSTGAQVKTLVAAGKKVYRALLTQSGTSDPTAVVLENSLGDTISFIYNDPGEYIAQSLLGVFAPNKTFILIGSTVDIASNLFAYRQDGSNIAIMTSNSANDVLLSTAFEIIVYP